MTKVWRNIYFFAIGKVTKKQDLNLGQITPFSSCFEKKKKMCLETKNIFDILGRLWSTQLVCECIKSIQQKYIEVALENIIERYTS